MWMIIPITVASGIALYILVAGLILKSPNFDVSRSIKVAAPPSVAFEQVNDLRRMNAWNPWVKLDPNLKQSYEGPTSGVGAAYSWDGNKNVGAGRQTIVESRPNELVRIKLEFYRPFPGVNEVQFKTVPEGDQTVVTWSMTGKLNPLMKIMSVLMSMDKMCGPSFEQGLSDMKAIVESGNVSERAPVGQR